MGFSPMPAIFLILRISSICSLLILAYKSASAQEIWLSPNGSEHYNDMFDNTIEWPISASNTKAIKFSTQFVIHSQEKELDSLITGAKRMHLSLAMAGLMLTGTNRCGLGIEGYTGPSDVRLASERIKAHGGSLTYIVMDSPLLFGHEYALANACQDSITSLARQVAEKVAQAESVFPYVRVGDAEPIGNPRPGYFDDVEAWLKAFQSATGKPLAFLHWDVDWSNKNWGNQLSIGIRLLQHYKIALGVIYNASNREQSGQLWCEATIQHFKTVEGDMNIHPDFAIIQSWNRLPDRMIPETQTDALTNVVLQYVAWRRIKQ
jgi:hypothetical protein